MSFGVLYGADMWDVYYLMDAMPLFAIYIASSISPHVFFVIKVFIVCLYLQILFMK